MHRLIINITILIVIFMYINLNESKPFMFDNMWPDKIDSPVDHTVC